MADSVLNVLQGGAVVSLGAWVTAGGAGTLTDVGIIQGGLKFDDKRTYHKIEYDHHLGELKANCTKRTAQIKFKVGEMSLRNLALSLDGLGMLGTSTSPNNSILHNPDAVATELQCQFTAPGLGTNKLRTFTAWKGVVTAHSPIDFSKTVEQSTEFTIDLLQDLTVVTADQDYKFVDS